MRLSKNILGPRQEEGEAREISQQVERFSLSCKEFFLLLDTVLIAFLSAVMDTTTVPA